MARSRRTRNQDTEDNPSGSRRRSRGASRRSRTAAVEPIEEYEDPAEEVLYDEYEEQYEEEHQEEYEDEPAPRGRSSRRSRAGDDSGNRRSSRKSSKKSAKRSSKKPKLSKEERAAKRKALITGILWFIIIVGVIGGGAAAWFFLREEPQTVEVNLGSGPEEFLGTKSELASIFYDRARTHQDRIESALGARLPDEAEEHVRDMAAFLSEEVLGGGSPDPSPEDKTIGNIQLARSGGQMMAKVPEYEQEIQDLRDERRATANLNGLKDRMADFTKLESLDQIEDDMTRFTLNPVDPDGGSNAKHQENFSGKVQQAERDIYRIQRERLRRLQASTTDVVQIANLESERLMNKKQFSRALDLVDTLAEENPEAELDLVRNSVLSGAEQGWNKERTIAENFYRDAMAPGTEPTLVASKIDNAIEVLQAVIDHYGDYDASFERYVREAQSLKQKYEDDKP